MKISYTVDAAHDGRELRQLVRAPLGLSAKLWKHIKWNGTILVNGKPHGDARLRVRTGDELTLELRVAPEDMGKVIGRQGRIAKEIRTLIRSVAQRTGQRVSVEIVD